MLPTAAARQGKRSAARRAPPAGVVGRCMLETGAQAIVPDGSGRSWVAQVAEKREVEKGLCNAPEELT